MTFQSPLWRTHKFIHKTNSNSQQSDNIDNSNEEGSGKKKRYTDCKENVIPQSGNKDKGQIWMGAWLRLSSSVLLLFVSVQQPPRLRPSLWEYTQHTCNFTREVVIKANQMWESYATGNVSELINKWVLSVQHFCDVYQTDSTGEKHDWWYISQIMSTDLEILDQFIVQGL